MSLAALTLLASQATEPSCRTADARVEALISSKTAELRGKEYCQFRLYRTIEDVDGDRREDFVVVFAVEGLGGGGNNSVQYLAVFPSTGEWKPVLTRVGQRGVRAVTDNVVDHDGTIALTTLEQLKGDAMCCPTGKGQLRFRLQGHDLVKSERAAQR
jgi:hypothetical protein